MNQAKRKSRSDTADIEKIVQRRLRENKRVRRTLPDGGRIHIDRLLPFVCVYRKPPNRDDVGTERMVTREPSYIVAVGGRRQSATLAVLLRGIGEVIKEKFNACMLLEIWADASHRIQDPPSLHQLIPSFKIVCAEKRLSPWFFERLENAFLRIRFLKHSATVDLRLGYLSEGGDIFSLIVGKIGIDHVPIIQELLWRGGLKPPPLKPLYLERPDTQIRLEHLKGKGGNVHSLPKRRPS